MQNISRWEKKWCIRYEDGRSCREFLPEAEAQRHPRTTTKRLRSLKSEWAHTRVWQLVFRGHSQLFSGWLSTITRIHKNPRCWREASNKHAQARNTLLFTPPGFPRSSSSTDGITESASAPCSPLSLPRPGGRIHMVWSTQIGAAETDKNMFKMGFKIPPSRWRASVTPRVCRLSNHASFLQTSFDRSCLWFPGDSWLLCSSMSQRIMKTDNALFLWRWFTTVGFRCLTCGESVAGRLFKKS